MCSASNTPGTLDVFIIQSDSAAQEYRGTEATRGGNIESAFITTLPQFTTSHFSHTSYHHSAKTVTIMVRPKLAFTSKERTKGGFQILKGFVILKEKWKELQR